MKKYIWMGSSALLFSILACRPVLAIGWGEFLILLVLIAILIGPPIYRALQRIENSRRQKDK
jgi:hypothetical protein